MKQSLQLKVSQQLTLTPQLQQSIRLLQLSTLDLQQEIENILHDNPMLERDEGQPDPLPNTADTPASSAGGRHGSTPPLNAARHKRPAPPAYPCSGLSFPNTGNRPKPRGIALSQRFADF